MLQVNNYLDLILEFKASIGVHPRERKSKQKIIVSLQIEVDIKKAIRSDSIKDAFNYEDINNLISKIISKKHYNLIETLASVIFRELKKKFPRRYIRITIDKPEALQNAQKVAVTINTLAN